MILFKSVFASKAFWGAVLALLSTVPLISRNLVGVDLGQLADILATIGASVGSAAALVFRVSATDQLVSSAKVADLANRHVEAGAPPDEALVSAKASLARADRLSGK